MPRKKKEEEIEETADVNAQEENGAADAEENAVEASGNDAGETQEESSILETVTNAVSSAIETVTDTAASVIETVSEAVAPTNGTQGKAGRGNRAEKIGVVASDKMQKTVTVRVDRLVKHPMYRKYVRQRKKFMAHDELGAAIGDKVRIVETRPLSARKRWRVVEIIQKAEK